MYYNVILKSKTSFLDRVFTYKYDDEIQEGTRVVVPFGRSNSKALGLVIGPFIDEVDFEAKEIYEVLDIKPIVSKELINLALYMIRENISDYGSAINTILPPGSIDSVEEQYIAKEDLKSTDKDLYDFLQDYKNYDQINDKFPNKYKKININKMVEDKLLDSIVDLASKSSIKTVDIIEVKPGVKRDDIPNRAKKQLEIIDYLLANGPTEKSELLAKTKASSSSLKTLSEKEYILINTQRVYRKVLDQVDSYKKIVLNDGQKKVFETILNSPDSNYLLHGVTGSGKTEVYLQLVEEYLKKGQEAIILVPEISLTPQTIDRFQGRFGDNIAVLHSKLSISQRADQWRLIKNKQVKIVVGARSAIFAPFENLGIIVIDEEHESSYRSDKNPKYSAIDIAKERTKFHNCKLILGTATPSVKTYYDSLKGNIKVLHLQERANKTQLPDIQVIDMREELKSNNFSMFSNILKDDINQALKKGNQSILFLNKRGHSSFVFCRHCGFVHKCDACDVSMTYHKSKDRLICHYCGRTGLKPRKCINCGSTWIKEYGAGTEMLEEQTREIFPQAKVYRMDADTVTKKEDYEKVYRMMKNKEIDILIGTQMLAKGLDFPDVEVVGIVSADISLNLPDFRSGEKTYNLITQVAGRAGRGSIGGKVVIQTYNPNHYAITTAAVNDYDGFYKEEMEERKIFSYPPYISILKINLSSIERPKAIGLGRKLTIRINSLVREGEVEVLEITGPTPSLIEKINNRYRFDIIVKAKNKESLIAIANDLREIKDNKVYVNYKLEEE